MSKSTIRSYTRHWHYFQLFLTNRLQATTALPIPTLHIALFIAHLHDKNLSSSTIRSYITTISFMHKLGNFTDPTKACLITKTILGLKNSQVQLSQRLPITKNILQKIIQAISFATNDRYVKILYTALFLFTYHACLRVGEVAQSCQKMHALTLNQITQIKTKSGFGYEIKFLSYKHSKNQTPTFHLLPSNKNLCPVAALSSYLAVRPTGQGSLFIHQNKKSVTRQQVSQFLKLCLKLQGYDPQHYNTHSLRIGQATQLANDNTHSNIIKATGRWKSSAYHKYIQPSYFVLPN